MIDLETISLEIRRFSQARCLIHTDNPILFDPRATCSLCQHILHCQEQLDRAGFKALKSVAVDYLAGTKTRDEAFELVKGIVDYMEG